MHSHIIRYSSHLLPFPSPSGHGDSTTRNVGVQVGTQKNSIISSDDVMILFWDNKASLGNRAFPGVKRTGPGEGPLSNERLEVRV